MADDREQSANEQQRLRHVETDVLIPKIMREKAKDLCKDYVKGACCNAFSTLEFRDYINIIMSYSVLFGWFGFVPYGTTCCVAEFLHSALWQLLQ